MIERLAEKGRFFLLAVSGLIHLIISFTLCFFGNYKFFPSLIFEGGILTGDAPLYVKKYAILSQSLLAGDWHFLFTHDEQIHVRLYTLSYTILSPLFGDSVLSYELVNLPLFLLAIFLMRGIGKACFDKAVGLRAGIIFLFFPTMLAHFSQPLRDPLAICLFLALFLILAKVFKNALDLSKALLFFAAAVFAFFLMWLTRENMLPIYLGFIIISVSLYIIWNIRQLRQNKYNFLMLAALLAFCLATPVFLSRLLPNPYIFLPTTAEDIETLKQGTAKVNEYQEFLKDSDVPVYLEKLNLTRHKFLLFYRDAGTNIDDDVLFRSPLDIIRYAPRALEIGLLAPFPKMWFANGKDAGRTGRIISGVETLLSYILMIFAVIALVKFYRSIFTWQIFLTVIYAEFILGIGVVNVGALYRLRYVFWCLMIVLAAKGICFLTDAMMRKTDAECAA